MIAQTLRVTVAPDRKVTMPHASGIKELPGTVLKGGDTFETSRETAKELLAAGLILERAEWVNNAPPPPAPAASGVYIWDGRGPFRSVDGNNPADLTGGIPEKLGISSEHRAPLGYVPPHDCTGGERYITHHPSDVVGEISADGRAWPNW